MSNLPALNETTSGDRLQIGVFGKRNSGKSSLINAITGQQVSIVSDYAGTTTDPVVKAMEIHGLGACVFIDTAGFDDEGELGAQRIEKTRLFADKVDIAIIIVSEGGLAQERAWAEQFRKQGVPVLVVVSQADRGDHSALMRAAADELGSEPIMVSAVTGSGIPELRERLIALIPEDFGIRTITANLVSDGDIVLLVMPQDIQAPKGRLILPQVQTIRELLDKHCIVVSATTAELEKTLAALKNPPTLIITDSQAFKHVAALKPAESRLTSFSILFAAYKGDIEYYMESAAVIDSLTVSSRVLIAECCTHAPLSEDIGREKLPRALRKIAGESLTVDMCAGSDFPPDLSSYDLIIQCGACMFNRRFVVSRIERAKAQGVPMTNYGVALAYINGILGDISV